MTLKQKTLWVCGIYKRSAARGKALMNQVWPDLTLGEHRNNLLLANDCVSVFSRAALHPWGGNIYTHKCPLLYSHCLVGVSA